MRRRARSATLESLPWADRKRAAGQPSRSDRSAIPAHIRLMAGRRKFGQQQRQLGGIDLDPWRRHGATPAACASGMPSAISRAS